MTCCRQCHPPLDMSTTYTRLRQPRPEIAETVSVLDVMGKEKTYEADAFSTEESGDEVLLNVMSGERTVALYAPGTWMRVTRSAARTT